MSCSSKRNRHIGSCSSTLVSSTKSLAGPLERLRLGFGAGCGAGASARGASAGAERVRACCCCGAGVGAGVERGLRRGRAAGAGGASRPPPGTSAECRSNSSSACGPLGASVSARASPDRRDPLCEERAGASIASGESSAARFVGAGGNGMCQVARKKVGTRKRKSRLKTQAALFGGCGRGAQQHAAIMHTASGASGPLYAVRWTFPTRKRNCARLTRG